MLKTRVIPTLLWKNVGLVKGVAFESWRRVGTVLPAIRVYNAREVDELILLDITATEEGRGPDIDSIRDWSCDCFVPLTVGGGIRNVDDIRSLLLAGADKVALNTVCYGDPQILQRAAVRFGSQCLVGSMDCRKTAGGYECYSHSGSRPTGKKPAEWARQLEVMGAGEILVTSVERDGAMTGYDLDLIRLVTSAVSIPVIAAGGAGEYGHMAQAVQEGRASAVAAASIFHFTQQTPMEAKRFLASKGIPVRL